MEHEQGRGGIEEARTRPAADHMGSDFPIKDPDGFDIQVSHGTKVNRREGVASGILPGPTPYEPTG